MSLRQPINRSQLAADLSEMIFDLSVTCAYMGLFFTASAGDRTREVDFKDHGVQGMDTLEIVVLASVLTGGVTFKPETDIIVAGDPYIVNQVSKGQDQISFNLQLRAKYADNS